MRLGLTDQIAGWQAVVADTWYIDERRRTWSDRVDQDKMVSVEAERGARTTWRLGRSRSDGDTCRRFDGLASKPSVAGLVVWASKPLVAGFSEFGPQNSGGGSDLERTARGGIREVALMQGY